jgi:ketosteroid isomerase-like protein
VERDAVLFANEAFYRAFADRDLAAMEALWSARSPVACIHPGWNLIAGRDQVMASWRGILSNPQSPAVACRRPQVFMQGDSAFVVCFEEVDGAYLIATNYFRREPGGWKMTHHQAGPVPEPEGEDEDEAVDTPMH